MERILAELSNPLWWFSVVLAGIAINILSSYLRSVLDKFFSKSSSWWRNRSQSRRNAWEERVRSIISDSKEREELIVNELRTRLKAICYLLLSLIFLYYFSGTRFVFLLFLIIFSMAFSTWIRADNIESVLQEAREKLSKKSLEEEINV